MLCTLSQEATDLLEYLREADLALELSDGKWRVAISANWAHAGSTADPVCQAAAHELLGHGLVKRMDGEYQVSEAGLTYQLCS